MKASSEQTKRHIWLRIALVVIVATVAALLVNCATATYFPKYPPDNTKLEPALGSLCNDCHIDNGKQSPKVSFTRDIQPIFNARCVNCHSCYDAPAQLNLSCAHGVERGATKQLVYNSSRLLPARHTRLHVDAQSEEEWRKMDFFSVTGDKQALGTTNRLRSSILYQMMILARENPVPPSGSIRHLQKSTHDPAEAPTLDEFPDYANDYPHGGMPYFMAPLTVDERKTITHWLAQGAPLDHQPLKPTRQEQSLIDEWEQFLNQDSAEAALVSRYLFEHLFLAHLYFEDLENSGYFKLVRSSTGPGEPVKLIRTPLPSDDPGVPRVFYRFTKLHGILKRKTHIPFPLGKARMQRLKDLFYKTDWQVTTLPTYDEGMAVRPFQLYFDIPARSRYEFMLDHAEYFIRCFIQGPVCRGQTALDAIHDHTFITFQKPESDPSVMDKAYMKTIASSLVLPGNIHHLLGYPVTYSMIKHHRKDYIKRRENKLDQLDPKNEGPALHDIWFSNEFQDTAWVTTFRHFDTGTVSPGFVGPVPRTVWVLDYPIFERIYYLLVVNYDVFERASHQIATRQYFDLLRHEAESNFLRFMPPDLRVNMHEEWYRGTGLKRYLDYQVPAVKNGTQINYTSSDPKREFILQLKKKAGKTEPNTSKEGSSHKSLVSCVETIPAEVEKFVQFLPEVIFVRIRHNNAPDGAFTIIRNKEHSNVAYIFGEESRREPEKDSLLVLRGLVGNYPNMFLDVSEDELPALRSCLHEADSEENVRQCILRFGVLRNSPEFWPMLQWFQEWDKEQNPISSGVFDLNHYLVF